ncbi:hypothetical protein [Ottowia sp.]|uniref:hypothetical protein n=1 Tax=Ottowia sp. TaxID=1898956 RepID=UPI0025CD4976|nr:hypothetical protein [Ottowia sp.]MBK6616550.1 hypothetical protein [Ottowia sp.]
MKRVLVFGLCAFLGGFAAQVAMQAFFSHPAVAAAPVDRQVVANRMYVMTPDGRMRVQVGTYDQVGERGLPVLALSDNRDQIRLLLRLAGSNESPVLVMKDKSGRDRLVMGLGLGGESEEPFLYVVNDRGVRTDALPKLR